MNVRKYHFNAHGDTRGQLIAIEEGRDIPFAIKRIYYIYNTESQVHRGLHAHRNLEQILICVHGSCKICLDDGEETELIVLDRPWEGIYLSNMVWRDMFDFSPDAVLLVLASDYYKEEDYIRDYNKFLHLCGK